MQRVRQDYKGQNVIFSLFEPTDTGADFCHFVPFWGTGGKCPMLEIVEIELDPAQVYPVGKKYISLCSLLGMSQ